MLASNPSAEPVAEMRGDRVISGPRHHRGAREEWHLGAKAINARSKKPDSWDGVRFFFHRPFLKGLRRLRSELRSSVRGVIYSLTKRQELASSRVSHSQLGLVKAEIGFRAYPLLDEVTCADVGSR